MRHLYKLFIALLLLGLCVGGVSALTINDYNASLVTLLHANYDPANPTYFNDSSLNNHIFTNYGTVAHNLTSKQLGNASGWLNSGYLNTTSTQDYNFSSGEFTYSMWIQRTRLGVEEHFVQKSPNGADYNIRGDFETDNTMLFVFTDTSANNYYLFGEKISDYNWHQVGAERIGNNLYSIKDGIRSSATAISNPIVYGSDSLFIGTDKSLLYPFKGNIDEIAIWKGVGIPNATLYNPTTELTTPTPPVASFTANATSGAGSLAVLFTDTSTGNRASSWQYNFTNVTGNNTPVTFATTQNPTHIFNAGNYSIVLTATNTTTGPGVSSATWVNVSGPNISADFTTDKVAGVVPLLVSFTDASTSHLATIDSYYWIFGDQGAGNTSSLQNPSHTYTIPGTYIANLTITNISYGLTSTKLQTIIANETLAAEFTGAPLTGGVPLTVTFSDDSTGVRTSWLWTFGDGNSSTLQNPSHTYVSTGSYNVDLNITGPDGTTNLTKNAYITTTDAPTANWTADKYYGMAPLLVSFTDTSMGAGITWDWDFGDGNSSALQNPPHTFVSNGEYQVNLTVTNGFGSSSKLRNITVSDFTSSYTGSPVAGAFPLTVTFSETTTGLLPDSYYYEFGDGNTSTSQNPTHTYVNHGYYTVNNRITNGSYVYWNNKTNYIEAWGESASFTVSNTTATNAPLVVLFTSTTTNTNATPSSYLWVFGDGTQSTSGSSVTHTYDTTFGTFNANLTTANATQGVSSTSSLTTLSRVPSTTISNISYNFVMNQIFPSTIMIKDSSTLALINGASISVDGGTPQIATNGILSQYFEYGSHNFFVSADNYNPVTKSLFIVSNSTYTIYLTASSNTQNTLWSPQTVAVQVLDSNNNPIKGTMVNTSAVGTTLPGGLTGAATYFQNTYGMSSATASSMLSGDTIYSGTTDSYGYVVVQMASVIEYRFTVIDALGYPYSITTYPQSSWMQIKTPNATTTNVFTAGNTSIAILKDSIHVTNLTENVGGTLATLNVYFYDASHTTTSLDCWFKAPNSTMYWQNTTFPLTAGLQTCNMTVPADPFTTWQWGAISA